MMRGDYLTAQDCADAARDLLRALQRAGIEAEIDGSTVIAYHGPKDWPTAAMDATVRGGTDPTVALVTITDDGTAHHYRTVPYTADPEALALVVRKALTNTTKE
jgi:hypothetical protein